MPKNVYADKTNNNKLTVIILVAVIVVVSLVISGIVNLGGWPGRTPEGALLDAQVNATRVAEGRQRATLQSQQAASTAQVRYENTASTAQAQYAANQTAVAVTERARVEQATATVVRATEVASNNATSTAFPPTATAQALQATADAESTAISWMVTQEVGIANATATQVAVEFEQETARKAGIREIVLIVCILLAFTSSVGSIILVVRIWFIHIKPLSTLRRVIRRNSGLADRVPELSRRLQEVEERMQHAEKQEYPTVETK